MKTMTPVLGIMLFGMGMLAGLLWQGADPGDDQIGQVESMAEAPSVPRPSAAMSSDVGSVGNMEANPAVVLNSLFPGMQRRDPAAESEWTSDPETAARGRQLWRAMFEIMYPDLRQALDLTPEEADRLLDLLAAHQVANRGLLYNDKSAEERAAAIQQAQREQEPELQALLGIKYPQWQDYDETLPAWRLVRDLRASLDAAGMPLADAQAKPLVSALADVQRTYNQQVRSLVEAKSGKEALDRQKAERNNRFLQVAASHLPPGQFENFRAVLERVDLRR